MRYKFRAWYLPTKEMVQPEKIESINFEVKTLGVYLPIENKGFNKLRMSDFELMQFTGLHDRNGKEIYEGDIVKGSTDIFDKFTGQVSYAGTSYVIDGIGKYKKIREELNNSYEVIGNIYEKEESK